MLIKNITYPFLQSVMLNNCGRAGNAITPAVSFLRTVVLFSDNLDYLPHNFLISMVTSKRTILSPTL